MQAILGVPDLDIHNIVQDICTMLWIGTANQLYGDETCFCQTSYDDLVKIITNDPEPEC